MAEKTKPDYHKGINDMMRLIVELLDARNEVAELPLSKPDKAFICASLKGEIKYKISLLTHIIEQKRGPSTTAAKRKNHDDP